MLAIGITLMLPAVAWMAVAAPLLAWYDARAQAIAERQAIADHMTATAAGLPALRLQAAAVPGGRAAPPALLPGSDDAVAGAALQEQVQRMAADADAQLASMEVLPATAVGAYRRIGLRLAVSGGTWSGVVRLLQNVATASPRMVVDDLQVHRLQTEDRITGTRVDASFDVLAFRSAAPAPPAITPRP